MRGNKGILAIFVVFVIIFFGAKVAYVYGTANETVIFVKRLDTKGQKSGDGYNEKYLVFTKDKDVFQNTDSPLRLKFNSSSIQGKLDEGKKFRVKYYGWRIGFFSMYPNIYEVELEEL